MRRELKQVFIVKLIQYSIYGISVTAALLTNPNPSNWPYYLVLGGIFLTYFLPIQYRSNFSSTAPGLLLKNHTRHLENIIDMTITCLGIFLVVLIPILKDVSLF